MPELPSSNRVREQKTTREVKFSETLATLINEGGYRRNREKICKAVGISQAALSQYLNGRTTPSFDSLIRLAVFFDVSLDYLVFGTPDSPTTELDYGPLARYVDLSLSRIQNRSDQRSAMIASVASILAGKIDNAVEQALEDHGSYQSTGTLSDDDALIIESYGLETQIISMDLQYDIISLPGSKSEAAGRFFPVVVKNLTLGRTYQFMLPNYPGFDFGDLVGRLRSLLSHQISAEQLVKCNFRISSSPLFNGLCMHKLDGDGLQRDHPIVYEKIKNFIFDNSFGYAIGTSGHSTAKMIFNRDHLTNAKKQYASLWRLAQPL